MPAFGLWRTVDNDSTVSCLTSGDLVLLALIWASSSSFLISNFCCWIWSARSQRSSLCLPRFVGAGGLLRSLACGVLSWLTAVVPGWTCFACSGFPTALSKGMSNWKREGNAGDFFDLHPAAEAIGKLESSIKDDEKQLNWHKSERMKEMIKEHEGRQRHVTRKGPEGGLIIEFLGGFRSIS